MSAAFSSSVRAVQKMMARPTAFLADMFQDFVAANVGQRPVNHEKIERTRLDGLDAGPPFAEYLDLVPLALEQGFEHFSLACDCLQ